MDGKIIKIRTDPSREECLSAIKMTLIRFNAFVQELDRQRYYSPRKFTAEHRDFLYEMAGRQYLGNMNAVLTGGQLEELDDEALGTVLERCRRLSDGFGLYMDIPKGAKIADSREHPKEAVVNTVLAGWKTITYFHFEGRDAKNIITESYTEIRDSAEDGGDWILLPDSMAIYHQNGIGEAELKFVCKDGREAVFSKDYSIDGSYQLVTDPRYKGTYNYCNPALYPSGITDIKGIANFAVKGLGHLFADILPYYIMGCKNERNQ